MNPFLTFKKASLIPLCLFFSCGLPTLSSAQIHLDPFQALEDGFVPDEDIEGVWEQIDRHPPGTCQLRVFKDGYWATKSISTNETNEIRTWQDWGGTYMYSDGVLMAKVTFVDCNTGYVQVGDTIKWNVTITNNVLDFGKPHPTGRIFKRLVFKKEPIENLSLLQSLAIINVTTPYGSSMGSGFIFEADSKKYLVTNQHVISGFKSISIETLTGEKIKPVSMELSKSLDLVRMSITNDLPAITLRQSAPVIGNAVAVYGNSGGAGVATKLNGKILGIGPDFIEVDAKFIGGNSGCPILDDYGHVLGVASFALLYKNPDDWVSKDTRFQEVRRYGIRLPVDDWSSVSIQDFRNQSLFLADAETSIIHYAKVCYVLNTLLHGNRQYWNTYYEAGKNMSAYIEDIEPKKDSYFGKAAYDADMKIHEMLVSIFTHYNKSNDTSIRHTKNNYRTFVGEKSTDNLIELKQALKKTKFVSTYLQEQADGLVSLCDSLAGAYDSVIKND